MAFGQVKAVARMTYFDWIPYEKHEGSASFAWLQWGMVIWPFSCSNPVLAALKEFQTFQ